MVPKTVSKPSLVIDPSKTRVVFKKINQMLVRLTQQGWQEALNVSDNTCKPIHSYDKKTVDLLRGKLFLPVKINFVSFKLL